MGCCDPAVGGQTFTYQLAVTNNGPNAASSVVAYDQLRPDMTLVSAPPACGTTRTVRCTGPRRLAAGATWTIPIVVKITGISGTDSIVDNVAYVKSATHDPLPFNNQDDEWMHVTSGADVILTMTGVAGPTSGQITYSEHIVNNGPSKHVDVVVTWSIPPGTTVSAVPGSCAIDPPNSIVICVIGGLTAGQSADRTVVIDAGHGTFTSDGAIRPNPNAPPDPDPSNNTASASVTI